MHIVRVLSEVPRLTINFTTCLLKFDFFFSGEIQPTPAPRTISLFNAIFFIIAGTFSNVLLRQPPSDLFFLRTSICSTRRGINKRFRFQGTALSVAFDLGAEMRSQQKKYMKNHKQKRRSGLWRWSQDFEIRNHTFPFFEPLSS